MKCLLFLSIAVACGLLLAGACSKNSPTEVVPPRLELQTVEVTASSVLFLATVTEGEPQQELLLYRDNQEVSHQPADSSQFLLSDEGLTPGAGYSYHIAIRQGGSEIARSESVSITCGDTTGQDFTWQIDTLGIYGSYLSDVFVVNENDVWAVGDIRTPNDTSGNTGIEFNAVHWDGQQWEFMRIPSITSYDSIKILSLRAIHGFAVDNIWVFSDAGSYSHWNGSQWQSEFIWERRGGIQNIGGLQNKLYFVGNHGSITLYNGQDWRLLPKAGDLTYYDVDGNAEFVFAIGYDGRGASDALRIRNNAWGRIFTSTSYFGNLNQGDFGRLSAVKCFDELTYFVSKAGLLKYHNTSGLTHRIPAANAQMTSHDYIRMSGNNPNDLMLIGLGGRMLHFNGRNWMVENMLINRFGRGNFYLNSGQLKGDFFAAAGYSVSHAIVVRGYRM